MSEDQLFTFVALLALAIWLGARFVPDERRATVERIAFVVIGGGIALAIALTTLHFIG